MKKSYFVLILLVLFMFGLAFSNQVDEKAMEAMKGNTFVEVSVGDYLVFKPLQDSRGLGLIFYPQEGIDMKGYALSGIEFAEDGITVFVPQEGSGPEMIDLIMDEYSYIELWAVGGHGVGGNLAAEYIEDNEDLVEDEILTGLILWGADAADADLDEFTDEEDKELNVLVVRGTKDAVTTAKEINDLRDSLPEDTSTFVFIPGGNNSNYANCGLVCGDNPVPLCCDEQQDIAFRYTKNFLEMLSGAGSMSISLDVH